MNIKSLLSVVVFGLGALTSTGHAGKLSPEREARINDIARTLATICTTSKAASLLVGTGEKKEYGYLTLLSNATNHLHAILDATVEGSDSDPIMLIKRGLDVLEANKDDSRAAHESCIAWAKQFDGEQVKAIGVALANFMLKEVIYNQTGNAVNKYVAGDDTNKRLTRRGIKVITNIAVESLLDAAQAYAKDYLLNIPEANKVEYTTVIYSTALKVGMMTAIEQITGELCRRGLATSAEEAQQLKEAVNAIQPTV